MLLVGLLTVNIYECEGVPMVRVDECRDRVFRGAALDRIQHPRMLCRAVRANS